MDVEGGLDVARIAVVLLIVCTAITTLLTLVWVIARHLIRGLNEHLEQ